MPKTKTWESMETALVPRWDDALWVRGSTYAVLAWAFAYPEQETVEYLRGCAEEISGEDETVARLRDVLEDVKSLDEEELQRQHTALFNPSGGLVPHELNYREFQDAFARAQELADIRGFYRAFGVKPTQERCDHVTAELGFMHYLVVKEKYAEHEQSAANAEQCRQARGKFFREHLNKWIPSFIEEVRACADESAAPFYVQLTEVLNIFMRSEREDLL